MTLEQMIEIFEQNGYEWSLSKRDGRYDFLICRPEWVTSELAQAVPLPQAMGNSPFEAVKALFDQCTVVNK